MSPTGHSSPEELYQQGVRQFNRADWRGAIASFTELQEISDQYPDADSLLADAQLKLQFEGASQPAAMAPPRRPVLLPIMAALALLVVAGSAFGFYYLNASAPEAVVAMATQTPEPPTAVTTPEPTVAPTAVPTPEPTPEPILPGTVVITSEGEFITSPANIEIIVDASGSMLAEIPGSETQRWQVAQEALTTLINSDVISPRAYTVVRTYGRNRGNDCSDLELAQGLSRYNKEQLIGTIQTIKPAVSGTTPLGASLRLANEDLQAAEGSTVVILVTDGLESCNGDPVAEAANLVAGNDQRKVHVIGFAIDDPAASDNLRRIADAGRGLYFDAGNSQQLAEALRQTIELSFEVLNEANEVVASGKVGGEALQLAPGQYRLRISSNPPVEKSFDVESDGRVTITIRQGFGGLVADIEKD